jgi:hypothetical protein
VQYRWGDNERKLNTSYYFQSERGKLCQKSSNHEHYKLDMRIPLTYSYVKFELTVLYRWGDNDRKLKILSRGMTLSKIIGPWPNLNLTCIFLWYIHMSNLTWMCATVTKIMNGNWWWRNDRMPEWRNRVTLYAPAIFIAGAYKSFYLLLW